MNITLVGDVMIGRSFNTILDKNPLFNVWGDTLSYKSDFHIGNLETTITSSTTKYPKTFNFKLHPKYKEILFPFSYLNLANNHILDYKKEGIIDTINTLDSLNIMYTGAGLNEKEAKQVKHKKVKGNNIYILSAADHYSYWKAGKKKEGVWYYNLEKEDYGDILETIRKDRRKGIWIFSTHWGSNWEDSIPPEKQRFALELSKVGVNIIHGTSPHHIQQPEQINNTIVLYSLGDFIDDYAIDKNYRNDIGMFADISFKQNIIDDVNIYRTIIKDYQVNFL